MAERTVNEVRLTDVHPGHENHMCELVAKRQMDKVATLAKGAKHVCYICGRAAASSDNLCEPVKV